MTPVRVIRQTQIGEGGADHGGEVTQEDFAAGERVSMGVDGLNAIVRDVDGVSTDLRKAPP